MKKGLHTQLLVLYSEISLGSKGQNSAFSGSFSVKVNIEAEALDTFYARVKEKGIEEKCILKIIKSGNRIILFPKDIILLICKYKTKKQISIVKIPTCMHNVLRNRLL